MFQNANPQGLCKKDSRNTFYYHFEDMPALVEAVVLEEVDGIMRRYASISSMEECFDAAMQFCVGHT